MQIVYTCFSVVEVDLTFNSDGSSAGMDLMNLVHIIYILEICSVCRCHLSQSCPNSLL